MAVYQFKRRRKSWRAARFAPHAAITAALAAFGFWWNVSETRADSTSGFACAAPTHHDGDAIRCGGSGRSMRLYGIDAPEMPGACRSGRQCTPGDPYASRDHLASLTAGRSVRCEQVDADRYGRLVVRCTAGGVDLSCQMVRDGFAVERYGRLRC